MSPAERFSAIWTNADNLLQRAPPGIAGWSVDTVTRFKAAVGQMHKSRSLPSLRERAGAVAAFYGKTIADLDPDPTATLPPPPRPSRNGRLRQPGEGED